ncbi:hypothetical protein LOK49_LG13G02831 [Camellia lanceoleosa]|uniref:Uncharacterized protein n=1 Tax=Camellia lanceoleosa TaxID=1840588 RepID=A0ACC0FGP3_9ERIC|nr:hypothetical protein LOK49_LG13G02831 [Camellia lanceoleosa]
MMPHNGMFVADLVSKGLFRNFYEKLQAELMLVTLFCSPWFQKRLVVSAQREKATQSYDGGSFLLFQWFPLVAAGSSYSLMVRLDRVNKIYANWNVKNSI